jgi:hypothetical protein
LEETKKNPVANSPPSEYVSYYEEAELVLVKEEEHLLPIKILSN